MLTIKSPSIRAHQITQSLHFWVILASIASLAYLYQGWPWRDWPNWLDNYALFEFRFNIIGSFFILPIIYSVIVFWWRGTVLTWILSMAVVTPLLLNARSSPDAIIINLAFIIFPLLAVSIITMELNWRNRARKTAVERETERQEYMSRVFNAQEDERHRISQELHDGATQTLLAIANRAETLVNDHQQMPGGEIRDNAIWIRDTVLSVSEDVRRISLDLRPHILDNIGLTPALRWLVDQIDEAVTMNISITGTERKFPPEVEVLIFRIVQEALSNIQRHSEANNARVDLEYTPESIIIRIADNGKGFHLKNTVATLAIKGKMGLAGIKQRVEFLKGTLTIKTAQGKGTTLEIKAPC